MANYALTGLTRAAAPKTPAALTEWMPNDWPTPSGDNTHPAGATYGGREAGPMNFSSAGLPSGPPPNPLFQPYVGPPRVSSPQAAPGAPYTPTSMPDQTHYGQAPISTDLPYQTQTDVQRRADDFTQTLARQRAATAADRQRRGVNELEMPVSPSVPPTLQQQGTVARNEQAAGRPEAAVQATWSRGQVAQDDAQNQNAIMGLINALKTAGLFGAPSPSAGGVSATGTWTPSMPTAPNAGLSASGAGPSAPSSVAPLAPVDTSGAMRAAFARAKDQVGQTSAGAIAALRSVLGGRGMLGSGNESRGAASVINAGQGQLGDVSREQAIADATRAQHEAEVNYQGGLTQRGQDITQRDQAQGHDLTARGQDIGHAEFASSAEAQARQAKLDAILGLYKSFGSRPGAGTVY